MINLDGKGPFISQHLQRFGLSIKQNEQGDNYCTTTKGDTGDDIDRLAQSIIDDYNPLDAAVDRALTAVDEIKKTAPWRPSPEDLQRLADTEKYIADGRPGTIEAGQYRWLVDAAETQGLTIDEMADYIVQKHDEAFTTEQARLTVKAQIRTAISVEAVDELLKNYTTSAKENAV